MRADDGQVSLDIEADLTDGWNGDSLFASLDEASAFYAAGSLGYSTTPDSPRFQGLELSCVNWRVEPLAVQRVRSSLFDNRELYPPGSAKLDCALLMRGIEHQWQGRTDVCCAAG
jgi:hypothetical protein